MTKLKLGSNMRTIDMEKSAAPQQSIEKYRDTMLVEYRRALQQMNQAEEEGRDQGVFDAWDTIAEFLYNELVAMGYTPQFDGKTGALLDPQPWDQPEPEIERFPW